MAAKNPTLAHGSPSPDADNSISLSFHTNVARCISRVEERRNVETASIDVSEQSSNSFQNLWLKYCSGGTLLDATIIEAAQQIGQSVLTLPWIFSNMGYALGVVCLLGFSFASAWTQTLLITLLAEYRKQKREGEKLGDTVATETTCTKTEAQLRHQGEDDHIASYHTIITYFAGHWWGNFSLLVVSVGLIGLSTVQIISTASNLYLLEIPGLDKRDLSLITSGVFAIVSFLPTFRDYRAFAALALLATTYTAWYMTISSAVQGPIEDVQYDAPSDLRGFFTAFTSLLFMFGGHIGAVEKADVMNNHAKYDIAFVLAILYVYTITLPNGITTYYAYGTTAQNDPNAFYLFEASVYRDIGLILMCLHEFVAFGLFIGPLFHIWEKFLGIDHRGYLLRSGSRLIIVGIMAFLAVAFPFFGVVNCLLGAFTTTFGTFILPCIIYNKCYSDEDKIHHESAKPFPIPLGLSTIKIVNWVILILAVVFGLGFGGWASMMSFIDSFHSVSEGLFAKCYGC